MGFVNLGRTFIWVKSFSLIAIILYLYLQIIDSIRLLFPVLSSQKLGFATSACISRYYDPRPLKKTINCSISSWSLMSECIFHDFQKFNHGSKCLASRTFSPPGRQNQKSISLGGPPHYGSPYYIVCIYNQYGDFWILHMGFIRQ